MNILEITKEVENLFDGYELCRTQKSKISDLREKLENNNITVAVIGQFKRGKTTFVNKLMGKKMLPAGIVPITAAVTRLTYGEERVEVIYENGLNELIQLDELSKYVSEQENKDNFRGVSEIAINTECDFLKKGIVLVDTPGVGSTHEKNSTAAYDFVTESDAVIFMLSVDSPVNKIETDFLETVKKYAGKFFFAVNKIDVIDEEDLEEYVQYCNNLLSGIMGEDVKLFPLSSRSGEGIDKLEACVTDELLREKEAIMEKSVRLKLIEIIESTRVQLSSYRNVLNMAPNVFNSRFNKFHDELNSRKERNHALDDDEKFPAVKLNDEKYSLKEMILDLFGIEYYFDMEQMTGKLMMSGKEFSQACDEIYEELEKTLNAIFMYKETDVYTVARRIEDLNILIRKMGKISKLLATE